MANTRGKSLPQEGERRLLESLRAARLRLFDTPTADLLRRLFGDRRLVNGAPPTALGPRSAIRGWQAGSFRRLADPQELSAQRRAGSQAGGHPAVGGGPSSLA